MKINRPLSAMLSGLLIFLPACATHQAQQIIETRQREFMLNTEAWHVARGRLKAMCPAPPLEEFKRRRDYFENTISKDPKLLSLSLSDRYETMREYLFGSKRASAEGCDARVVKLTNEPRFDDWDWDWLPTYQTIVAVHDEELRRRVTPKIYEQYMLGLSRYLAERADKGEITDVQLIAAFNQAWKWMLDKMQQEAILLRASQQTAQVADAAFWNALGNIAAGLALVAGAALVASAATRPAYQAPPTLVHCTAIQGPPGAIKTVTVTCW